MDEAISTTDYPAAHSMDTSWWGVDSAGEVAYFQSHENGVRPTEVQEQQEETCLFTSELRDFMAELKSPYLAERTADEFFADPRCMEAAPLEDNGGALICQFRSVEEGEAMIDAVPRLWTNRIQLPCRDGSLVYIGDMYGAAIPPLLERFKPMRWGFWFDWGFTITPSPAFYGFWTFTGQGWGEPYKRLDAPKPPLRIDQLPERLRPFARRAVFSGIRFADTPILQPMEHMKCVAWSCSFFIDSTLKIIRPIPGCEEQYKADEAEIRREYGRQYDIRPWNEPWPRPY